MCPYALLGLLALAHANPVASPQELDLEAIELLPPPPTYTIAVGALSQSVTIDQASLLASVSALATRSPLPLSASISTANTTVSNTTTQTYKKRQFSNATCSGGQTQPTGSGPVSIPDTAASFQRNPVYGQNAMAAKVPFGYNQTFSNMNASTSMYPYMGYTTLASYDAEACAAKCTAINGCHAINIYYERNPSIDPSSGTNCEDPPSTTWIKCVFWGGPGSGATSTNAGQTRGEFQVLIAGSNGYVNYNQATPKGFTAPKYIGNVAIQAPTDCNEENTYMGVRTFNSGPFDVSLCAAACSATTEFNLGQGVSQTCTFFSTYLLLKNGQPLAQYCAMYSQTWNETYAKNVGQWDGGGNHYTIAYSYMSSNTTKPGECKSTASSISASSSSSSSSSSVQSAALTSAVASSSSLAFNGATACQTDDALSSCNNSTYLQSGSTCICQMTSSGQGVIFDTSSFPGQTACNLNTDCPSGSACITTSCNKSSVGVCSPLNTCGNAITKRRIEDHVRRGDWDDFNDIVAGWMGR